MNHLISTHISEQIKNIPLLKKQGDKLPSFRKHKHFLNY